jgi:hypothetical protein
VVHVDEDFSGRKEVDDGVLVCGEGAVQEWTGLDGFSGRWRPDFVGRVVEVDAGDTVSIWF